MAQIWRDKKYSALADRLVSKETGYCGHHIFPSFRELLVFSAMVGFHYGKKSIVKDKAFEVPQRVFETSDSDVYVYLCSLQDQKSGEIFREKNETECWRIFESYANSGLEIINNWLLDTPGDIDGVNTILNEMKKVSADLTDSENSSPDLDTIIF